MIEIREATAGDRDAIWGIFREVVAASDTYAFDPGMSRHDALGYWFPGGYTDLRCRKQGTHSRHIYSAA